MVTVFAERAPRPTVSVAVLVLTLLRTAYSCQAAVAPGALFLPLPPAPSRSSLSHVCIPGEAPPSLF